LKKFQKVGRIFKNVTIPNYERVNFQIKTKGGENAKMTQMDDQYVFAGLVMIGFVLVVGLATFAIECMANRWYRDKLDESYKDLRAIFKSKHTKEVRKYQKDVNDILERMNKIEQEQTKLRKSCDKALKK